MPHRLRGVFALLLVTLVWGTTFPAMKDLSAHLAPVWIVLVRFVLGGLLLSPFLRRAAATEYRGGAMLGVMLFAAYMFQVEALTLTSANRNAFITGLSVLLVPLLGVVAGRTPESRIVIGITLALGGLFALCWDGGAWSTGDTLALIGALCFAMYVKQVEVRTRQAADLMALTAVQVLTVAGCAALWIMLLPQPAIEVGVVQAAIRNNSVNLIYLGVIATAAIISLQTWGQRHASANEAAVIYALEPACAAVAAYFWLAETMTWRGIAGGLLLIAGIIASQWNPAEEMEPALSD